MYTKKMNTVDDIDLIISKLDEIIYQHIEITHEIILSLYERNNKIDYIAIRNKKNLIENIFNTIPDVAHINYKSIKTINNLIFDLIKDQNQKKQNLSYFENLQKQILSEISNIKISLIEIKNNHDYLTKLPLRKLLVDNLNLNKIKNEIFYLSFIDIDYFKKINDEYGYDIGDRVLIDVSKTIKFDDNLIKAYRYGGEEFILLIYKSDMNEIKRDVFSIHDKLKNKKIDYINKNITLSSGTILYNNNLSTFENITNASKLMKKAKNNGRNQARFSF